MLLVIGVGRDERMVIKVGICLFCVFVDAARTFEWLLVSSSNGVNNESWLMVDTDSPSPLVEESEKLSEGKSDCK